MSHDRGGVRRKVGPVPPIPMPARQLGDGTVALRAWRPEDAEAIALACRDPLIARFTSVGSGFTAGDARLWLAAQTARISSGELAPFAITVPPEETAVGSVSLQRFAWGHRRGEVGYWLAAPARGRGLATRAVNVVTAWGFAALELQRLDLLADVGNRASQRVAELAGFTREGILRSFLVGPQGRYDAIMYSRLPTDTAATAGR